MPAYCIVDLKKLIMWLLSRIYSLMPAIIIMATGNANRLFLQDSDIYIRFGHLYIVFDTGTGNTA